MREVYSCLLIFLSGSPHIPPQPYLVRPQIETLLARYHENQQQDLLHPIENIARLHADFVAIHPFIEGNGRTGRLLMNMELMKSGYPVAIIESSNKHIYYEVLQESDKGNYQPIKDYIASILEKQLTQILDVIYPDWNTKNQKW